MKPIYYILLAVFTGGLCTHIYTDFKEQLLYDKVSSVLMAAGIIYAYYFGDLWQAVYGAMVSVGIMLVIYWLSRGGMGFGDVKLAFVLGVWLGLEQSLACLLIAFVVGGVVGVMLLLTGIKSRKDAIPFGPYLCVSGWVCLFYGTEILNLYWQLWQ
ncbi:MAG: prepilin peptidase [Phascolarctobacterium sp.]|nr:prepilin peptidase [Phascolarctobacterium sp.]